MTEAAEKVSAVHGAEPELGSEGRARELASLLERHRGERHLVAIQDFPDPDAISSALGYQELARAFDIRADVFHDGLISHPQNLALVNLLEIDVRRFDHRTRLDRYDAAVFVDTQGTTTKLTERLEQAGVPALAVIDHHDPQERLKPDFADIRPVGAAATIIAEYLESGEILELDAETEGHVRLATALMHGLHSETSGFILAGGPDYQAAAFLRPFLDTDLLELVLTVKRSRGTMDVIQAALARRVIRGGLSLSGVGYVRWSDRDAVPQAADFLLSEENVHTSVVYGILWDEDGRELVIGSLRTLNATLGVDSFLKRALGTDSQGRSYGGGRSRAGGFEIDTGFLAGGPGDRRQREIKWEIYDRQIRRKFLTAAGLDSEDEEREGGDALLPLFPSEEEGP